MQKQYDLAVIIGRFQLPHVGHATLFNKARLLSDKLLVIIGSDQRSPNIDNPFTVEERVLMLRDFLTGFATSDSVICVGQKDYTYSNPQWVKEVQGKISSVLGKGWRDKPSKVCIVGNKKADTGYLDWFPQYTLETAEEIPLKLSATQMRDIYFGKPFPENLELISHLVPGSAIEFLKTFKKHPQLKEEWDYIKRLKDAWSSAPYPVTFMATDALVYKSGHILLVKRGKHPGVGQWALPGGYLAPGITLADNTLKELYEETSIDIPPGLMSGSLVCSQVFDDPKRSPRGRMITQASLFNLDGRDKKSGLPKVKGGDDAAYAQWVPLAEVAKQREMMFEDHADIIDTLIARISN